MTPTIWHRSCNIQTFRDQSSFSKIICLEGRRFYMRYSAPRRKKDIITTNGGFYQGFQFSSSQTVVVCVCVYVFVRVCVSTHTHPWTHTLKLACMPYTQKTISECGLEVCCFRFLICCFICWVKVPTVHGSQFKKSNDLFKTSHLRGNCDWNSNKDSYRSPSRPHHQPYSLS